MPQVEHAWIERRAVTLRDVAQSAGVSESTASVVLNGARSGTRVSDATRKTVVATAERMGYRPNAVARSLQTGRTNRIGIYSGRARLDARNLFFAELLGGAFEGAHNAQLNTLVHTSGSSLSMLRDLISNRAIDGLLVHAPQDDPILPLLGDLRIPAVAVVDRIDGLPSVCVDDQCGAAMIAQHLVHLGHRRVLVKNSHHGARSV